MKTTLRYFTAISAFAFLLCFHAFSARGNERPTVRKIVLDPGHGGADAGCVYGKIYEKNIVLAVALKLGKMLEENLPDVEVIYTRKTDVFVDLYERGRIANNAKADLFVSIHVDAQEKGTTASGTSTYILGHEKNESNLKTTMRENSVILYEKDYETKYQGYDPNDPESFIIFSLMQYAYREQSLSLANMVQKHYTANTGLRNRKVWEGGLVVLVTTAMPSILTEMGYITNENDRKFITSEAGQEKLARSLFNAISEYKSFIEGRSTVINLDDSAERTNHLVEESSPAGSAPQSETTAVSSPGPSSARFVTTGRQTAGSPVFRIQVSAATSPLDTKNRSKFGSYAGKVTEKKIGNYYKYFVEETDSYKEALSLQRSVRQKFKDAFVVAFVEDQPVAITEQMKSR